MNSYEFKRNIKKKFNLNSKVIYNPLDKDKIIKFSKKKISFPFFKNKKCVKIINYGRLTDQKNHILLFCVKSDLSDRPMMFCAQILKMTTTTRTAAATPFNEITYAKLFYPMYVCFVCFWLPAHAEHLQHAL